MAREALIDFGSEGNVVAESFEASGGLGLRLIQGGLAVGGLVAPELAARVAEQIFFTPRRYPAPERESAALSNADSFGLEVDGRSVAVWRWGSGPRVYLVHGWSGRGGQLCDFVGPLLDAGFSVVAFDAPAHGLSEGRRTSGPEVARVLARLIERLGPAHGVIGHSMGGWATTQALLDGARIGAAVLVGAPSDPGSWARDFARFLRLSPDLMDRLRRNAERRLGFRFVDLSLAPRLAELRAPALVVHDLEDREVPATCASEYVERWPGARALVTEGLGHRRILRDAAVIRAAVEFLLAAGGRE